MNINPSSLSSLPADFPYRKRSESNDSDKDRNESFLAESISKGEDSDENETITNNLAKIIYDEAKDDAICRIVQRPIYHSDPER